MGQQIKILNFIVTISLLLSSLPSFGQNVISPNGDIQIGTVWFRGKSIKLTEEAKAALDTIIKRIQNNPAMQVQAVSYNKDFCDKCGKRGWKRATAILKYLSAHGVAENRLGFTNRLEGELNKVDIFLTTAVTDSPHPGVKKQDK